MLLARGDEFLCLIVPAGIVLVVLSILWSKSRSTSIIDQWANENGFELLSAEERWMARGPFFLTTAKGQTVYRVRVRDASGREREGYVRCGSFWGGLLSDKVSVKWDDEAR